MKEYAKKARESFCSYETFKDKLLIDDKPTEGKNGVLFGVSFAETILRQLELVNNRVSAINGRVRGERNFYCSEECKKMRVLFI